MGYSRVAAPAPRRAPAGAARDHRRHPHRDRHHIGLVTVTALIGQGGLGALMLDGLQRDFRTPLTVGIVLSLALAVVADLLLVLAQRLATPWQRAGRRTRRKAGGVMGFLGDVFDFLTNHDQWHGNESIPTLARAAPAADDRLGARGRGRRAADRHPPRARAHGRRGGGEHRQHRPRAARARAAHPRRCSGSGIGEPTGILTPVQSVPGLHRHVRPRRPADARQRVRRHGQRRRRDPRVGAGDGHERPPDDLAGRAAQRGAADDGRRAHGRRSRWSRPRRSRRTSTRVGSAATSSTASP